MNEMQSVFKMLTALADQFEISLLFSHVGLEIRMFGRGLDRSTRVTWLHLLCDPLGDNLRQIVRGMAADIRAQVEREG